MERLICLCAIAACFAVGCRSEPAPRMPPLQTEQGKANARVCLQTYNNCTLPCYAMRSEACMRRCNDALASCYAIAE
jgi:hypothetical protein